MTDFKPFRDKLHDHTLPVPEKLWDRIEANLPETRRRRIAPWFWMTLLGGVLLGGLIVYSALELAPDLKEPAAEKTPPRAWVDPTLPAKSQSAGLPAERASVPAPESRDNAPTGVSNSGHSAGTTENTQTPVSSRPARTSRTSPVNASYEQYTGIPQADVNPPGQESPTSVLSSATSSGPISIAASAAAKDLTAQPMGLRLKGIACPAPGIPRMRKPKFKTDIHCYKFSKNTGNLVWSADLYGGPGLSPRTLTDTGAESSVYTHARKATESSAYTWHAGGRVNLQLRNGLTFATGIEYTQAGDVFDYTDTLATQSTTRIDSFFAADGTFLYADTNRILVLGTLIKRVHNTYRYLDIPLLAGIEIPLKRSMLMVHAGPVLNIVSRQEGEILDPALHPRNIDSGRADRLPAYRSSLGLSLYIGGGILFPLTQNLSALVEPRLLYRINPVTLEGYPMTEKRHHAGLSLGLRYHFIKS